MLLFLVSMEKIQLKIAEIMRGQHFSPYKVYGEFFKHSRADDSAARGRIWLNFELVQALMNVVVPCEYGKDLIENSEDNAWTTFFSIQSLWGIFQTLKGR